MKFKESKCVTGYELIDILSAQDLVAVSTFNRSLADALGIDGNQSQMNYSKSDDGNYLFGSLIDPGQTQLSNGYYTLKDENYGSNFLCIINNGHIFIPFIIAYNDSNFSLT